MRTFENSLNEFENAYFDLKKKHSIFSSGRSNRWNIRRRFVKQG